MGHSQRQISGPIRPIISQVLSLMFLLFPLLSHSISSWVKWQDLASFFGELCPCPVLMAYENLFCFTNGWNTFSFLDLALVPGPATWEDSDFLSFIWLPWRYLQTVVTSPIDAFRWGKYIWLPQSDHSRLLFEHLYRFCGLSFISSTFYFLLKLWELTFQMWLESFWMR